MASTTVPSACTGSPIVDAFARMERALTEARAMSESIAAIVEALVQDADARTYPLLEAILACTQRLERAVDPVLDSGGLKEVRHG